ncbi:MAG: VIT1/CCC1 transporter family protein [Methanomicrobiales archaeon]|nr:VIT1/CCC1 transporter family protein [Methanomicrobiales archaeon]
MGFSDYLGRFWYSSEPMFGVIMVVCFTSVLRAYPNVADQILGTILSSALFCCIAWGLVDGIFYAWEAHYELDKRKKLQAAAAAAGGAGEAQGLVEDHLGDTLIDTLEDEDRRQIYQILQKKIPQIELGKVSIRDDLMTILIAFGLVVGSSIVVMVPFLVIPTVMTALIISNITGILLLFIMGYWREEDKRIGRKLATGGLTAFVALIITGVTVALGG